MNMRFAECLPVILKHEGGFVDDPDDPGGRTDKGITQKTYNAWLTKKSLALRDVKGIPGDDVAAIYETEYWNAAGCGTLSRPLDLYHFDAAVNHGVSRANRFLRASGGDAPGYLVVREDFYHDLVARKPALLKFIKGWLKRIDSLREAI